MKLKSNPGFGQQGSLVARVWAASYTVPEWTVDRRPVPSFRLAWVLLLHAVLVLGAHFAWPMGDWLALPLCFGTLPFLCLGTWIAFRAHRRVAPLPGFRESYKDVKKGAPYAVLAMRMLRGQRSIADTVEPPPGWFVYRTMCLVHPSLMLLMLGGIASCVLYYGGNDAWSTVGLAVAAAGMALFIGVTAVGLTARPVFLLPKLLRDAAKAGRPMSEEDIEGPPEHAAVDRVESLEVEA